jgi:small-conductance mechanosensitive channel
VRQAINLAILREFARLGIEFAYPTQTLYLAPGSEGGRDRHSSVRRTEADAARVS